MAVTVVTQSVDCEDRNKKRVNGISLAEFSDSRIMVDGENYRIEEDKEGN